MKETLYDKIRQKFFLNYNSKKVINTVLYTLMQDSMMERTFSCTEKGVSNEKLCEEEVIVSLTSYERRINDVAPTIESIMRGSLKPNRIILWLGEDLKSVDLPIALKKLQLRGLDVRYCRDVRSHTKLVPALINFPDASIITIDDDCIYPIDLVERLVREHVIYPKHIIANMIHKVKLGKNNKPVKYSKWEMLDNSSIDDSFLNFFLGGGGVLYPPHSLHPEVTNDKVFLDICKTADDVWFYAMSLMEGTHTRKCPSHNPHGGDFIDNESVQDTSLRNINTRRGRSANDEQLYKVFDKYNLWNIYKNLK